MMKLLDRYLDGLTMYRLALYYLIALVGVAVLLSAFGYLGYDPLAIVMSTLYLVAVCWLSNYVFARVFETPANVESSYITALILALIITPTHFTHNLLFLTAAGGLAMASKYILAIHKRHIFNPAAIAVLLLSIGAGQTAGWWVGTVPMLPFVLVGGLLLARKIRRLRMVFLFLMSALLSTTVASLVVHGSPVTNVQTVALHSSLFFLAFVMFTEPLTAPATVRRRDWYALFTGLLFSPQIHLFTIYSTPELALSIGNAFAYLISPKVKLLLPLHQRSRLTSDIVDFVFKPRDRFSYRAGQYVEVTLGHRHTDSRGNRRFLTLASSPTEDTLRLGVKFYPNGSSFKRALIDVGPATRVVISPPAGDFVLPDDTSRKLAFIAGGIGITPFRSMVQYLLDTDDRRSVTLVYAERTPEEFVYMDVFRRAQAQLGLAVVRTVRDAPPQWREHQGYITSDMIRQEIPDYAERLFYISGSLPVVTGVTRALHELQVPVNHVKTDYFPGYSAH